MAAKSIDDQMAALEALKGAPVNDQTIAALRKGLQNKSNFIAAKAVVIAIGLNAASKLRDAMKDAFTRFITGNDKGCAATTAIAKALAGEPHLDDEAMFLAGAVHVQMEPVWGGSVDAGVELRCESVAALVRMNSRKFWDPLVKLFADESPQARSTAARALAATGQDAAKYLLQYKILTGDAEPSVMGDCFAAVCLLTRSIEIVEPFLRDDDDAICEAAALALGESRLPAAFVALRNALAHSTGELKRIILLAIAMTRQPGAVDCLIEVATESPLKADDAMAALAMYRSDSTVREKIRSASQGSQLLQRLFDHHFAGA